MGYRRPLAPRSPRVKSLKKRLHYATVGYDHFILQYYPDRLHDGRPLFPMNLNDLCLYIDYKAQHCLYESMRKHISVLQHHEAHDEHWRRNVLNNLHVLKKFYALREIMEGPQQNLNHSPSISDSEDSNSNGEKCYIMPGEKKGFMITNVKPLTLPSPPLIPPASIHEDITPEESTSPKKKCKKLVPVRKTIRNGLTTMNLDVNLLANNMRIAPSMTPISQQQLPSIPNRSATIVIKLNEDNEPANSSKRR